MDEEEEEEEEAEEEKEDDDDDDAGNPRDSERTDSPQTAVVDSYSKTMLIKSSLPSADDSYEDTLNPTDSPRMHTRYEYSLWA
ncbi:hypothetical protein CTA1_8097 [Colletotrichum tanaceti]|uniref:Uncharacterized protein n=1 Tax=Colletotrichum tanaceti TaxID=1306861 RepID=A0A4V6DH67_9PEZI|nr:hypothetical protein CTA1_8097 [Colletotrichum tanaceti]